MSMDESSLEGTLDTVEFTLINLVKEYPELYNPQDPAYRDKQRKDLAWAEIARHMSKDEGWCYAKWKSLSDYYKKRKKIYGNGSSMTMRRWVYYDALSFLDNYENMREETSSRSSTECHHSYLDETQYHSLDGITGRSDVIKFQHFLEPLVETSCPPNKKQRTNTSTVTFNHSEPSSSKSNRMYNQPLRSNSGNSECDDDPVPILSVHKRQPCNSQVVKSSVKNSSDVNHFGGGSGATDSLNDCPHYHFCMSLAARFRKMDAATATYTQMKIMELILKTEFPDQYQHRISDK